MNKGQFKITEDAHSLENIVQSADDLKHLHNSQGISFYQMVAKYEVPEDELQEKFAYFNVHITSEIDWKKDMDALEYVADNGMEGRFADLIDGQYSAEHIKKVIHSNLIKQYDSYDVKPYQNPDKLREALEESYSVEAAGNKLDCSASSVDDYSKKLLDKPAMSFCNRWETRVEKETEETQESEESEEVETSTEIEEIPQPVASMIDLDSLSEEISADVSVDSDGDSIIATVELSNDGVIQLDKTIETKVLSVSNQ